MSGTKRKAAPPKSFDYACLHGERAEIARHAAERIWDRRERSRKAWLGDAFDVHRVHEAFQSGGGETTGHGHFKAWVLGATPFSLRSAYNLSGAARMLLHRVGRANFARLPAMPRVVVYRLAEDSVPPDVRDLYLTKLIEGETVTLRELDAKLNPGDDEQPAPASVADPIPPSGPTPDVMRFVRGLRHRERLLIRQLAETGQLGMLVQAVEAADWSEADPFAHPIPEDDANRLADRADEAIRQTPPLALAAPGTVALVVSDGDEDAPDAGSDSDSEADTIH